MLLDVRGGFGVGVGVSGHLQLVLLLDHIEVGRLDHYFLLSQRALADNVLRVTLDFGSVELFCGSAPARVHNTIFDRPSDLFPDDFGDWPLLPRPLDRVVLLGVDLRFSLLYHDLVRFLQAKGTFDLLLESRVMSE